MKIEELLRSYMPRIRRIARRYVPETSEDFEDLVQAGVLALIERAADGGPTQWRFLAAPVKGAILAAHTLHTDPCSVPRYQAEIKRGTKSGLSRRTDSEALSHAFDDGNFYVMEQFDKLDGMHREIVEHVIVRDYTIKAWAAENGVSERQAQYIYQQAVRWLAERAADDAQS